MYISNCLFKSSVIHTIVPYMYMDMLRIVTVLVSLVCLQTVLYALLNKALQYVMVWEATCEKHPSVYIYVHVYASWIYGRMYTYSGTTLK